MPKRSIYILFILLVLSFKTLDAAIISRVYRFESPVIERVNGYAILWFDGCQMFGEPGKATLPFYPVKILIPPGEKARSMHLEFDQPVQLPGELFLFPRQAYQPVSSRQSAAWQVDEAFYSTRSGYPEKKHTQVKTHYMNGFGVAVSAFTPITYIPGEGAVTFFRQVTITIETEPDPHAGERMAKLFLSPEIVDRVEGIVQNPEAIMAYLANRVARTSDYDYLVITGSQFLPEFDTLAGFYRPRGINSRVIPVDSISSTMSGVDLPEKIRNFIIQEYEDHGISYVMIGGDVQVVPYRGFYCQVLSGGSYYTDSGIPSDLYYSALDGNWNTDGDGLWAEPDEDDLFPELAVGRFSFSDTAELRNMLHKTMLYQSDPVEGELTSPLLAGEHLWNNPLTWGSDYMRLLVGYRTNYGYNTQGIPESHPRDTLYDTTGYTWSKATLMSHINSGRPWVHHVGHANWDYAMKLSNADITNANFSGANGVTHNFTTVYTHGCICGAFDYADCIGEKMVAIDNFAAAFIGNSRYGWFVEGTSDGPSQHLHREFVDALYRDSLYQIGMAHMKSKSETAPFVEMAEYEPGATRWCFYDNNVLGDPAMAGWTEEPGGLSASFSPLLPHGAESLGVAVSGPQGEYTDFTCTVFRNDSIFGVAKTDGQGTAVIPLFDDLPLGPAWLVISGYNILPQWLAIEISDVWLGHTNDWNDPANWASGTLPGYTSGVIIPADPVGTKFPLTNSGDPRQCKSILVEPGAVFRLEPGETFIIHSN